MSIDGVLSLLAIVVGVAALYRSLRRMPLIDPLQTRVETLERELINALLQLSELRTHVGQQQKEIERLTDWADRLVKQVQSLGHVPVKPPARDATDPLNQTHARKDWGTP